jgi:hypothetical protein
LAGGFACAPIIVAVLVSVVSTGIGGFGFLGWRRKRKTQTVA